VLGKKVHYQNDIVPFIFTLRRLGAISSPDDGGQSAPWEERQESDREFGEADAVSR